MWLEWRTIVNDGELWGWRLYDFEHEAKYGLFHPKATVRKLLCRTKKPFKIWLFGVEVGVHKKMFYTEEEAKAWVIAIVRL